MFGLFSRKTETSQKEETDMMTNPLNIDFEKLHTDAFEAIAENILNHEIVMNSPIDGTPIGVVRTEDVLNSITQYYGINIESTKYAQYKK